MKRQSNKPAEPEEQVPTFVPALIGACLASVAWILLPPILADKRMAGYYRAYEDCVDLFNTTGGSGQDAAVCMHLKRNYHKMRAG